MLCFMSRDRKVMGPGFLAYCLEGSGNILGSIDVYWSPVVLASAHC